MEVVVLMQNGDDIFDQLIDFLVFIELCGFKCLLHALLRLLLDIDRFLFDFIDELRVLDKRIKLRHDLAEQFLSLNGFPWLANPLLALQFLMQIDLLYIILKKDDLYLLLLHILQSTQYLKTQNLNIRLLIKNKIQYILTNRLIQERIITQVQFFELVKFLKTVQFLTTLNLILGDIKFLQKSKLLNPFQTAKAIILQNQRFDLTTRIGVQLVNIRYTLPRKGNFLIGDLLLIADKGRKIHLLLSTHSKFINNLYYNRIANLHLHKKPTERTGWVSNIKEMIASELIIIRKSMDERDEQSSFIAWLDNIIIKREMSNKYYHNDYKKMMGVDETRTASEKLLDKAIGGFRKAPEVAEKPVEKKVKEENINLTHFDVLGKLVKNIENNKNAVKLLKPLNILKKCLNDQSFVSNADINTIEQWKSIAYLLIECDEKLLGNYSEIGLVIDCLAQIFTLITSCIKKLKNKGDEVKQQPEVKEEQAVPQTNLENIDELIETCEIHLIYLKLYNDDSFAFNKLLLQFKAKFNNYFQLKLQGQSGKEQLYGYLQRLLMKLFNLPFTKYEWIKQSLAQFFKEFNISYKHLLQEDQLGKYLKTYNDFINQKIGKGQGQSVNIFGNAKGGKFSTYEVVSDGLQKWTTKQ